MWDLQSPLVRLIHYGESSPTQNPIMRVLITGHRGYIGTHAIDVFQAGGYHVTGIDVGLYDGYEFSDPAQANDDITADIFTVTPDMLKGVDAVVHLAAISNDPMGDLDPALTHRINTDGTLHVAEAAKAAGVPRFLFASSCSIYGAAGDTALDESASFNPVSAYAESKINAEAGLMKLNDDSFAVTCLRNATAQGHSPRLRVDLVVNNLLSYALTINEVKLLSDGTSWRPLIHCRDIARAFLALASAPIEKVRGLAVNVGGNEENYQVRQVAEIVHSRVPNSEITIADKAVNDPRNYRVSFDLLNQVVPDFQVKYGVPKAVDIMNEQFQQRPNFKEEFDNGRYTRLTCLKQRLEEGKLPEYFKQLA